MAAVKMGMFGERTRTTFQWYPHNSLAKRFNIPNPYPGAEIVGVPHMQKTSKKETLLNLGLPQTANELAHRAERHVEHVEEKEHDPDVAKVTKEEDLDRPPKSIFDAIFGESDNESDSDDEEEEEQEEREVHKDAGKERSKTEQQEANLPGSSKEREQNADEVKPKPITV
ncbi:unnamed protein product, partial [Nippostrongylus brasiliensis]|uniref:Transcription initiation factor TFIID subunit 7 n=1 Tax=Nippostrongylus brasiliensis TaxID=27835 RepID=A0A0N4XQG8_NIPBR